MSGREEVIVIRDLFKTYDTYNDVGNRILHRKHRTVTTVALSDINLTVRKGEIVSVIGRNGCGKSTLLKIIAGILKPTSGTVEVDGKVMGIVETGFPFQFGLPGIENIYLRGMFYGHSRAEMDMLVDEISDFAELGDAIYAPVKTYSTGMRARLAFSIMTHMDADIYVFDEALHTGDELFNRKASGYLHSLARKGKTVLLSSHSNNTLRSAMDRAILLENGELVLDAPCENVITEYRWGQYRTDEGLFRMADAEDPVAMYILSKLKGYVDDGEREELIKKAADKEYTLAMMEFADSEFDRGNMESSLTYYDMLVGDGREECMTKYAISKSGYDNEKLLKMFREMATVGDHFDKYRYAEVYRTLSIGKESSKKAFGLYEDAYKHGNMDAGYRMACLLLDGRGTDMNIKRALRIFTELATLGHTRSRIMLSRLHFQGKYVRSKPAETFKWCLSAAMAGDPESQFRVSYMYSKGIGIKVNEAESRKWSEIFLKNTMSRTLMDAAATLEYSEYRFGLQDRDLYRIGMEGFNERSTEFYVRMLMRSRTDADRRIAFDSIREYCTTSYNSVYLGRYYGDPSSPEFDDGKSFRLTKIAADAGNAEAMYLLANMYKAGFGTGKDFAKSNDAMRSAARRKNHEAMRLIDKDGQTVKKCMKRVYAGSSAKYKRHRKSITKDD